MGLMRFIVSPADCLTENMVDQAYLCSFDRVPWQARVSWDNGELRIERRTSDSASLHIPWRVEGYDLLTLSTGTLIERPEPYYLPLELARGKIAQTRNQLSDWQSAGLIVPAEAVSSLTEAIRLLSLAAVGDRADPRSVASASRALRLALDASYQLTSAYTEQVLAIRRRAVGKLNTFLGADLGLSVLDEYLAGQYLQTFNAARVPMIWREIESHEGKYSWDVVDQQIAWCRENRLTVCAGPLLQLDGRTVPDWLYLCE